MSIANLITTGNKSYQDITIDELVCRNANITNLDANNVIFFNTEIDMLYVGNINALQPASNINLNNNIVCNGNNIVGVNEIDTDILNVNTIQNSNPIVPVEIENDVLLLNSKRIKMTDDVTSTMSTFQGLHIQNEQNASIWLESDSDIVGANHDPVLHLSSRGNETYSVIRTRLTGGFGDLQYFTGQTGGSNFSRHMFYTGQTSNTAKNVLPSFINSSLKFDITGTQVNSYVDYDMNNNDIIKVDNLELNSVSAVGSNIAFNNNVNMQANNILGVNEINTSFLASITGIGGNISILSDLNMLNNNINDVNNINANDVLADMYRINNPNNHVASYSLTRSLSSNTDTILTNWNVLQTSPYINVNPISGIFSPEQGIYCMTYNHFSDHSGSTAYIGVRLTLFPSNQTVYSSIQDSNNLFQPETGFEASQYECLTGYFDGINQYRLNAKMNANSSVSVFNVTITRLF